MRYQTKLSWEQLREALLRVNYDIPVLALRFRNQRERASVERWLESISKIKSVRGWKKQKPEWIERFAK